MKSIYFRNFLSTALMVLLSFLIIGCALIFIGTVLAQVPVKIPRLLRKRE